MAISRVRTCVVDAVVVVDDAASSSSPGLPDTNVSLSKRIPDPIDLATSLPTRPLVEVSRAKLVRWLHSQSEWLEFDCTTLQPLSSQASSSWEKKKLRNEDFYFLGYVLKKNL